MEPSNHTADEPGARRSAWMWASRQALQLALSAGLIAAAVFGAQWLVRTKPPAPRQAAEEPVYFVETVRVDAGRLTPSIRVFGTVAARRSVELRALVDGAVASVHERLEIGERVPEGAELVTIDSFAYEGAVTEAEVNLIEARAKLEESEAQLARSENDLARALEQLEFGYRDVARATELAERGVGDERSLDDTRLTLSQRHQSVGAQRGEIEIQRARIEQQRAAISRFEWRLTQARRALADTVLRAPFDAVVRRENVEPGRRVGANDVVAELYEAAALDIHFTVSDTEFGRLQAAEEPLIGKAVDVEWRVGVQPVRAHAVIDRIGSDVVAERGGVELIARLESVADGRSLLPGAFVTVAMQGDPYEDAVRAPESALYNGDQVFIVVDGRLAPRAVEVLAWEDDVVLLSGDLDGVEILTSRLAEAGEGVRVRSAPDPASKAALRGEIGNRRL